MKKNELSTEQKKLLKCLLSSGIYFIPFTIDGNWDYADRIRVLFINELLETLEKDNGWSIEIGVCNLDFPVYMLDIYLLNDVIKKEILKPYRKFQDHYLKEDIKTHITLYLRYKDILKIYKAGVYKSDIWKAILFDQ